MLLSAQFMPFQRCKFFGTENFFLLYFFYFVVVLIFFRFVKPNTTKFFEEWYGV